MTYDADMLSKRGPGRPPRAGKKLSESRFELRLTEQERARWQRAADRRGVTLAEFIREAVEAAIG